MKPVLPLRIFQRRAWGLGYQKDLRVLSTSADEGKEFIVSVSEMVISELFTSGKFTSELFTSQVFTSDSVEAFVELVVSYAFEVVSSECAKKETENNSKLKLITDHTFLL